MANIIIPRIGLDRPPAGMWVPNYGSPHFNGLVAWYPLLIPGFAWDYRDSKIDLTAGPGTLWQGSSWGQLPFFLNSGYITGSFSLVTTYPISLVAWMNCIFISGSATGYAVALSNNNAGDWSRVVLGKGASDNLIALTGAAGSSGAQSSASSPIAMRDGIWHHGCASFNANNNRVITMDGFYKATQSTARATNAFNTLTIGTTQNNGGSTVDLLNHTYATDICVYNRILNDDEVWSMYDPMTRFDKYYQLGKRSYHFMRPPVSAPPTSQFPALTVAI